MATATLIYDGDCAFCTKCVYFIERRMKRHPVLSAWQHIDLNKFGLSQAECEEALQWIGDDGRKESAHIAVARTLIYAGKGWKIPGYVILIPGISQISGLIYRWIARNRHRLPGGTPACSLPQSERPGATDQRNIN